MGTVNDQSVGKVSILLVMFIGAYFIALSVLDLYALISLWCVSKTQPSVVIFGYSIGGEVRIILIAVLSGCLGSLIHAMTSFTTYIGNRQFVKSWVCWYILRPFIGMSLALVFYFVIRGGFFTLSADADMVSPFGVAGLGGLVGMFSKFAVDKLREIFMDIFKTTRPDERTDKLKENSEENSE